MKQELIRPMEMDLLSLYPIPKGACISIVGSGGKTTLVYGLAIAYAQRGPAVITTSAKMGIPKIPGLTFLQGQIPEKSVPGLYAYASSVLYGVKMDSIRQEELGALKKAFDYVIVEADGSRMLPIKFWKDHEPPVLAGTDLTVGVLPFKALGMDINAETTYYLEGMEEAFPGADRLTPALFEQICLHPGGLFKNALGPREVYISGVDSPEQADQVAAYARSWTGLAKAGIGVSCGGAHINRVYRITEARP